jgi:nucleoside 2-deoxyribosyltransferase
MQQEFKVYLAGAISGATYEGCSSWRNFAVRSLAESGIRGYSPLRAKDYLKAVNADSNIKAMQHTYDGFAMSTSRAINSRDHWDVMTSDVILVNLLGAAIVSIGTVMEIAWAHAYRKPTVLVMEKEGNIHDHPMVRESIGFRVETLEEGLHLVKAMLLPYFALPEAPPSTDVEYGSEAERAAAGLGSSVKSSAEVPGPDHGAAMSVIDAAKTLRYGNGQTLTDRDPNEVAESALEQAIRNGIESARRYRARKAPAR